MAGYDKPLRVSRVEDIPGHSMFGDWGLAGRPYSFLDLEALVDRYPLEQRAGMARLKDICAKPGNWFGIDEFSGPRYDEADPAFPGILVLGMPNPCALPYRLVDGRRRLHKLALQGRRTSLFYIYEYKQVRPFIRDVVLGNG